MTEDNTAGTHEHRGPGTSSPEQEGSAPWTRLAAPWKTATTDPTQEIREPREGRGAEPLVQVSRWLRQVDVYTGPDALLDFNLVDNVHIDLTDANPSGYAQLLAGRRTRLSTILRDRHSLAHGMRSAEAIREKIQDLRANHGLDAGFLAAGMASWFTQEHLRGGQGGHQRHIAPVLLVPVVVTPHRDGEDFELRLSGSPRINPALARQMRREHGVDLFRTGAAQRGTSGSRVTPEAMIEQVRTDCSQVPGMQVDSTTVVSTFADLSDTVGELPSHASSGPLFLLSELTRADGQLPATTPAFQTTVPEPDEVDPAEEVLVHDADERVSDVIQRALAGESLTVTAAPGTQPLSAALNTAAALVAQGKNVLMVSERTATLSELRRRIGRLGLDGLALDLGEPYVPEELSRSLVSSIVAHENEPEPQTQENDAELRSVRESLRQNSESLHWTDERWGISPYRAMQTLAELTARNPAPSTRVRFKRAVLDTTMDREETVAQLERAAELRAFNPLTRSSSWYGARLVNEEETKQARALAQHLFQRTQALQQEMDAALSGVGLRAETTVEGWRAQVDLLEGVQETLRSFTADIFDRSVADLIAATASTAWRRDRGIDMSAVQRSKLRRAAKEYIRPQVHIPDLHQALLAVEEQRGRWGQWAADHRQVSVPESLEALRDALEHLREELTGLGIVMESSPHRKDYLRIPVPELLGTLEPMAADRFLLSTLPEREQLLSVLRGKGLGELLADLEQRNVPTGQVAAELDLAWWQSAFEIMLARPEVGLASGQQLNQWEAAFRRADTAHLASGPARVRYGAAQGWRREVAVRPVQAKALRRLLKGTPQKLRTYLEQAPDVLGALRPLWLASPFAVGRALPAGARVDAVVLLDAESTPLGAVLSSLARTPQVIAFGDTASGSPQPFVVSPMFHQDERPSTERVDSAMEVLQLLIPGTALSRVHDAWDPLVLDLLNRKFYRNALACTPYGEEVVTEERGLRVDYLHRALADDFLGAPLPDSPSGEVRAVVEMVQDHATRNPRQSLAVLTASRRHAVRIAEGLRTAMRSSADLQAFLSRDGEPFQVTDLERAQGLRRDRVIFSLGVSPEAGGAPEHFGQLSGRSGRRLLVTALTSARFHLRVVSSLELERLRQAPLREGMVEFVELLEAVEQERTADRARASASDRPGSSGSSAFLATDDFTEDEEAADWLLADLSQRLRLSGAEVALTPEQEIDGWASAGTESLAAGSVASPRVRSSGREGTAAALRQRIPVALCSDGTTDYLLASVRERSRMRPERLERTGWNYLPLWTVDVFADPQAVASRVLDRLGLGRRDR